MTHAIASAQEGSRSAFIVLVTAGTRAHWEPRERGEAPRDENRERIGILERGMIGEENSFQ
jgi:hypothetical protein